MLPSNNKTSSFRKDERGNVAIIFGLTALPALLMIGGGVDFTQAYKGKQKIQAAADAAVLAAVGMPYGTLPAARQSLATSVFNANTQGMGVTPVATANANTVTVTASYASPTAFIRIAHVETLTVNANAQGHVTYSNSTSTTTSTTTAATGGKVCILALDPSAPIGIEAQGTPNVDYTGCWAHTNSTSASAIKGGGSASAVGAGHSAVGGVAEAGSIYSPAAIGGRLVTPDPFATVGAYVTPYSSYTPTFTPPSVTGTCKASNLSLKKGSFTLEPGRYCGGINLQAQATVTLQEGVYIIDNGIFNVQSGASITGSNVMLYFHGAAARMTVIGGGTVNLKGRTTGNSYAGFLAIAHPDAWRGLDSNIQGGGSFTVEGMVYMPTQRVIVTGNGDANASSNYFGIVAKSVKFQGNGIFNYKPHNTASNMPDIMPNRNVTVEVTTEVVTPTTVSRVRLQ